MTIPTASETNLLRSRPHNTKLWLSIFQPRTVAIGYATGTVSKGSRIISLYNVSTFGITFEPGQTMFVNSAVGDSKGRIRVREFTTGTVTVSENSDIDWTVGDQIQIIRFFEIWPIYPRIVLNTGTTTTSWYKDYDIPYTNQNSKLGYFICMGPHFAGFLDGTGTCQVYYSAAGTSHVRSDETGTSYYWSFDGEVGGRSPTSSNLETPGYVTYTKPGHFTTRLIVSGSVTQSSDFSDRHISIYDRPRAGTGSVSVLSWELLDLAGSRDEGGYTASIRVHEMIPDTKLKDGYLIVIFADDRYGTIDQSIGGNAINRNKTVFVGYVMDGTIRYNYRDSYVDFKVASPSEYMKSAEGFSVSVQDSDDPAADAASNPDIPSGWVALLNMDIKKAIYHYLKWHSTVMNCCDIQYLGTNQLIQYFDADRESIFDAINTLMSSAVVGKAVCDRQGKLWLETDIYHTSGTFNTGLSLTKQDWMGDPTIEERTVREISYLEMGGIAYNGTTFEALMAGAPGVTPSNRGRIERQQGLALYSQNQLNTLIGNIFAQKNAKYPNLEMEITGNYRNFDIAPQEKIPVTIGANDTIRGINFNQKNFFINGIQWQYNPETEFLHPIISFEEIASGLAGDSLDIPDVAPTGGDFGGFTIPPIIIPPFEIPPFPTFNVSNVILASCTYSKNESTGIQSLVNTVDGYRLYYWSNTESNQGVCSMAVPLGVSNVSLQAVFRTISGTGNIQLDMESRIAGCGGTPTVGAGAGSAYYNIPTSGTFFWCFGLMTHVSPAGNILIVRVSRDGTDPNDTFNGHLDFVGILATFS